MEVFQLDAFLRNYTHKEKMVLHGESLDVIHQAEYANYHLDGEPGEPTYIFEDADFLKPGEIMGIYRQDRFLPVSPHRHNYVELCYVWSGSISQNIGGEERTFGRDALCIFDMATAHAIGAAGEDDIIINILMRREFFNKILDQRIAADGIFMEFLMAAARMEQKKASYLYFETEEYAQIRMLMEILIREYYSDYPGKSMMLENYAAALFTELFRIYERDRSVDNTTNKIRHQILDILRYIEQNFEQCSVQDGARVFGWSPKYLTTMLKKWTGRSFVEHVQEQRFNKARKLLTNTDMPIAQIIQLCGYTNEHFFYEKFKQSVGMTPAKYRGSVAENVKIGQ